MENSTDERFWPVKATKVIGACVDTVKDGRFLKFQDSSLIDEVRLKLDRVREPATIYSKYKGPKVSSRSELNWPVKGIMLRKAK